MTVDVLIVGGSFAGLSAAMQLVRGRRKVLVVDSQSPRNRYSAAAHGVFGLDGKSPSEIRETALSQLEAYPTFELMEGAVTGIEPTEAGFVAQTEQGKQVACQRVILAMGITDELPAVESSITGIYVAGDLSNAMQNGTFAIASGCMAGIAAHQSFIFG